MSKALANPKLVAATGVLFLLAAAFNVYSGASPAPNHGLLAEPVSKAMPVRTGIGPFYPTEPDCGKIDCSGQGS